MDWFHRHLLTTLSLFAGTMLIAGALFVITRAPVPAQQPSAWSGISAFVDPSAHPGNPVLDALPKPSFSGADPIFRPLSPAQRPDDTNNGDDLSTLLASLTGSGSLNTTASSTTEPSRLFDFIPRGLIATSSPANARSPEQQVIYEYGNEVGSYIQSYESRNRTLVQVLKDQLEDRVDAAKGARVKSVGADLIYVGQSLENMEQVPEGARSLHGALAKSYREIGEKLQKVPDAQGDQAFLDALHTYNAAADTFARHFVALATYFSLNNVTFSQSDPGSVFSFTFSSGF